MRKAFDCLSHSQTIKKLEAYGFGSGSLDLMGSFFVNRRNRVKLSEITSDWKPGYETWMSASIILWALTLEHVPE